MADPRCPRHADAGVTLVEVLVVLALIGVSAGIISLALPSGPRAKTLDQEVALLVARLNLAAERSLTNGQHLRMTWQDQSYAFEEWRDNDWRAFTGSGLSGQYLIGDGIALSALDGSGRGTLRVSPDLLPVKGAPRRMRLVGSDLRRWVIFDGATARVEEAQP